jgi:hypothetical protein
MHITWSRHCALKQGVLPSICRFRGASYVETSSLYKEEPNAFLTGSQVLRCTKSGTQLDERIYAGDRNRQDAFPNIFTFLVCDLS